MRRAVSTTLAVGVLATVAGCGGGDTKHTTSTHPGATPQATQQSTPAPATTQTAPATTTVAPVTTPPTAKPQSQTNSAPSTTSSSGGAGLSQQGY